jgi:hypothetical protein
MQSNCMPCCHRQGPVLETTERINDIVQHGSFTPFCKKWLALTLFWILELLVSELLWLGGLLGHLLFSIPLCLTSTVGCTVITNLDLWQVMNCFRPPAAGITNTTNHCHSMELSVKTLKMSWNRNFLNQVVQISFCGQYLVDSIISRFWKSLTPSSNDSLILSKLTITLIGVQRLRVVIFTTTVLYGVRCPVSWISLLT